LHFPNESKGPGTPDAKEILAEVFRFRVSEVDEMIQNRFDEVHSQEACCEEDGLWPQEFWLER
jgi:hypothetical protein